MIVVAVLVSGVLSALGILHVYWALGGRWGHAAALGVGTAIVAAGGP